MSSGAKVISAYAKQTDVKTTPKTGWKTLPVVSNGLNVSASLKESEIITDGRIAKSGMVTGAEVSGTIDSELMYGAFDDLIAAAFWSEWQTGTPDTLSVGNTKTQFAITKDFTDINVNHLFKGCALSSMGISVDAESLVKINFGFIGLGYEESTVKSFSVTPTRAVDGKKASSQSIGTIKMDNQDIGVCVESFEFNLDNSTEVQKCLGDNIYGGNVLAMLAAITGKMTLAYSVAAHNKLKEQLTGRTFSIEFPIIFNGTDKYVIKIPKAQISGDIPSPSGKDLVTVDLNYTVVDESPVIERHHA